MSSVSSGRPEASERARCPRRYELVRVVVGEASVYEGDAVRLHAASCKRCRAIFDLLVKQRDEFSDRYPFEGRFIHLYETTSSRHHRRQLIFRLAPFASVACLLVVGLFVWVSEGPRPTMRTKGGTQGGVYLGYYVQQDQGARLAGKDEILSKNERIQFTYHAGSQRYLFLVSIDDQGRVSNFNYQSSAKSLPLEPGGSHLLEGSIILDNSKGPERVFGIFSEQPLTWQEVKSAALQAYREAFLKDAGVREIERLPLSYPQASVLLLKR